MKPLITVCITTYNRVNLLPLAIHSVLEQSYENYEIIIIDDYSTDSTQDVVNREILKLDQRISYIRHKKNKGLATARNTAIFNAKGKYFTFVDDDDTWDKNFLSTFIKYSEKYDSNYIFCASIISTKIINFMECDLKSLLYLGYTPPVASQFYNTESLKKVGGYNPNIKSGIDHDLWLTLGANNYKIIWINDKLVNVNSINIDSRITYNIDKRVNGIKHSLIVWKKSLQNEFEDSFFNCLEKNYKYNTYRKFTILALKNNDILLSLKYISRLPINLLFRDLIRFIKTRIFRKKLLIHPTFFHCLNSREKFRIVDSIKIK